MRPRLDGDCVSWGWDDSDWPSLQVARADRARPRTENPSLPSLDALYWRSWWTSARRDTSLDQYVRECALLRLVWVAWLLHWAGKIPLDRHTPRVYLVGAVDSDRVTVARGTGGQPQADAEAGDSRH